MAEEILFFGNEVCPWCRLVIDRLRSKAIPFEFIVIPMDRDARASHEYTGSKEKLRGKTFGELFDNNTAIPKMIAGDKKFFESSDMIEYIDKI